MTAPAVNLRYRLREATARAHDLLDDAMRAASGWKTPADYVRFLQLQHASRAPLETWLDRNAPVDLNPPHMTPLIAQDLAAMNAPLPWAGQPFSPPFQDRDAVLGAAWALAGSALGNRSILKEVRRTGGPGESLSVAFLGDPEMIAFWGRLRRRIEGTGGNEQLANASAGAAAVFDHFLATALNAEAVPCS
jgi:heme oxygenase